eukprot:5673523-Prymnesium_polylepis.1
MAKFDNIAEAYEVLSNSARRAIFDQYGEAGLKNGVPDGSGGVKGGKYQFNNNATEIFTTFFGTSRRVAAAAAPYRSPSSLPRAARRTILLARAPLLA